MRMTHFVDVRAVCVIALLSLLFFVLPNLANAAAENAYFCDANLAEVSASKQKDTQFRICSPTGLTFAYKKYDPNDYPQVACSQGQEDECQSLTKKYVLTTRYSDRLPQNLWPDRAVQYSGEKCLSDAHKPCIQLSETGEITLSEGYAWDGPSGPAIDTIRLMRSSLAHDAFYDLMRSKNLCNHEDTTRTAADAYGFMLACEDGAVWPKSISWAGHSFGKKKSGYKDGQSGCLAKVPGKEGKVNKGLRCVVEKNAAGDKVNQAQVKGKSWINWRDVQ